MRTVLEYLEHSAAVYPQKTAVEDDRSRCSYEELEQRARRAGSTLAKLTAPRQPIVVLLEKSVEALISFLGIAYAGCFYVFLSPEQPLPRVARILAVTQPACIITHGEGRKLLMQLETTGMVLDYRELEAGAIDDALLRSVRVQAQDTDPLYCNFTSGSTGVPKGVLISHRSVRDFMDYFPDMFHITEKDRIGNQAPFDFDVSVKDIYSALKVGATLVIIPKRLFSIPMLLLDYLCERKVTTLIWAVSALCLVTQLKGLTYKVPADVNKILFSGEIMPIKHLRTWQAHLPDAEYVNLYGPTEITCNCTYYRVEREFALDETLPIGKAFPNERVFLLDEQDRLITGQDAIGELCVAGTALALGYYNNPEQTQKAFVPNPLNPYYMETIYRTGDLAYYNADNDLCFAGRKDFQIKYMGHRIELEEIEAILHGYPEVERACCLFDRQKNRILACYAGSLDGRQIKERMQKSLPLPMVPAVFYQLPELPVTGNGKIDRKTLLERYGGKGR